MRCTPLTVLLVSVFIGISCRAAGAACTEFQAASSVDLVSFLDNALPDGQNSECVAFAIATLGTRQFEPAIFVLTKFLDFHWPLESRQKQRLSVLERDGASIYPAATALEQIGMKSAAGVLAAIETRSTTRVAVDVAVGVWMEIHKADPVAAVTMLKQRADSAKNTVAKQRLNWAAFRAATQWCSASDEPRCKAALGYPVSD